MARETSMDPGSDVGTSTGRKTRGVRTRGAATACLLFLVPLLASAEETPFRLSGYGEINYWRFDYGPDQKSLPEGSAPDNRALIDVTRLALEFETELLPNLELEAEVEFEHGGTGGALELEYEEFGEYEQEVEKGGEVILEELYVKRSFGDKLSVSAGHFYVAVGLLSSLYHPLDFYGTVRSEAETSVIPALWHETGIEASGRIRRWRWRFQVINGLDATGFSSQSWVAGGHQLRFEQIRADGLALTGRVDYEPAPGALVGVSLYRGDSAANRPKPDMKGTSANVTVSDIHAHFTGRRLRARGLFLYGHLENAAAVSARNRTLSNNLDVLRSPVARAANALYLEAGYDILPWLATRPGERVDLFARYDDYDTMAEVPDGFFDYPRFDRRVYTLGVNYAVAEKVVVKADYAMRRLGEAQARFNDENTLGLALGFQF